MSFGSYARSCAWEFLLVFACTWALGVVVMNGFWVDGAFQHGPVPPLVGAVILAACYLCVWKRSSRWPGAAAVAVAVAVAVGASIALSAGDDPWADSPENYLTGMLCVLICTLAGFLLTRTLLGSAVWFTGCVFACAFIEAAYRTGELALSLVVLVSALSLVIWRNCMTAQRKVDTLRRVSRTANFGMALAPVAGTVALACVVWFGVIAPLAPPELKLELLTDYRTQQIVHVKGVGDIEPVLNTELKSNDLVDGQPWTTDDLYQDDDAVKEVDAASLPEVEQSSSPASGLDNGGTSSGSRDVIDHDDEERRWDAISYSMVFPIVIAVLLGLALLALVIAAYFAWRRARRSRRLERWLQGDAASQVEQIYLFIVSDLAALDFKVPPGSTLSQWTRNSERGMDSLHEQTHVPFSKLTEVYEKVAYGGYQPTDEEVVPFVTWYLWLWKAARAHLGNVRYFFKSFRLG